MRHLSKNKKSHSRSSFIEKIRIMEKQNEHRHRIIKLILLLIASIISLSVLTNPNKNKREEESKQAFAEAYKVFMHPRCLNCHPAGDVPFQGDSFALHTQGVKRGPDGKGLYAMKCKNCHQDTHTPGQNMPPGHPNWHLPPADRKMVFEGKTPRQLAMAFKDPKFTGFNSMDKFLHHIEDDTLVKNSFTYGIRPPLTHQEFAAKVREWVEKGAVLPDK
jgi:hypothetical protein